MMRKIVFLTAAVAASLTASAGMYIMGPGTADGYSLDAPIEMKDNGGGNYTVVCYLTNGTADDGTPISFRLQSEKEFNSEYYYAAFTNGQTLSNDEPRNLIKGYDTYFSVAQPGVYLVSAQLSDNADDQVVKIQKMGAIYGFGAIKDNIWGLNELSPLAITSLADNAIGYTGSLTFVENGDDSFKFALNPGETFNQWANNGFLFRGDTSQKFRVLPNTSSDDAKWTIGWPDQDNHQVTADLVPATFRLVLDMTSMAVNFFLEAESASIAGDAVGSGWFDASQFKQMTRTMDGDNVTYVGKHIYFLPQLAFKPVINGKFFGIDNWSNDNTTVEDNSTVYLRQWDNKADFIVAAPGFRNVTLSPSASGDGTMSMTVSAPESVWYEGLCAMKYDAATNSYITDSDGNSTNTLHYIDATDGAQEIKAMVGGDAMASWSVSQTGWYAASVTFNGATPSFNLEYQQATVSNLSGSALSGNLIMGASSQSGRSFIMNRVMLNPGRIQASIFGWYSNEVNITKSGYYTLTVTPVENGNPVLSVAGPIVVNMPLKEADFAGNQPHYFLVGQRMGAWRLQPEWEFVKQDDGSFTIPERLLYNGYVMVGMVDNYDDYIAQTYTGYTAGNINEETTLNPSQALDATDFGYNLSKLEAVGENGCSDGKFTGTRYNDILRTATPYQHGGLEAMKLRMLNILDTEGYGDIEHIKTMPSRVNLISLKVDGNGIPTALSFNGVTVDPNRVAEIRTFSLCGGGIRNLSVPYEDGVSTSPLNNMDGYSGREWADAWIQFSAKDVPYVDGYGEYIYQTSFTRNWLGSHPSYFKFVTEGEAAGLEYTSNNVTFTYQPGLKHDAQFGQRKVVGQFGLERDERVFTYSTMDDSNKEFWGTNLKATQNLDDIMIVNPDSMVCYAVENMWMVGDFKVWSGWGGSATNYEYDINGSSGTRWYGSNASHGAQSQNRTAFYDAGTEMVFTLFRDIPAANFAIGYGPIYDVERDADGNIISDKTVLNEEVKETGEINEGYEPLRRFYNRVEIWFNLKSGFAYQGKDVNNRGNASFMVFHQELRGPQISIAFTSFPGGKPMRNHISYTYSVQSVNNMPLHIVDRNYGLITYYRIERVMLDANGNEGTPVTVEERSLSQDEYMTSEDFAKTSIPDPKLLDIGRYVYKVHLKRANTGDTEFPATSNILAVVTDPSTSGVETVNQDATSGFSMKLAAGEGVLRVSATGSIGRFNLYSVGGALVKTAVLDGETGSLDVSSLTPGIYIATANNTSQRVVIR